MTHAAGLAHATLNALPAWLERQRWYGDKGRTLQSLRVDWCAAIGDLLELSVVKLEFTDGGTSRYFLPLCASTTAGNGAILELSPGCHLVDAAHDTAALDTLAHFFLDEGILPGLEVIRTHVSIAQDMFPVRPGSMEQSNSAFLLGNAGFAKIFRRLPDGLSPDWEIGLHLTQSLSPVRVPQTLGAILWHPEAGEPVVLVQVWEQVENAEDAWTHGQNLLEELLAPGVPPELAREEPATGWCRVLGMRTGELHRALMEDRGNSAFTPKALTDAVLEATALQARTLAEEALILLEQALPQLPEHDQTLAIAILARKTEVLTRLGEAPSVDPRALRIRCHGDFHLGQVLWKEGNALILDFEGEPARSLEQRRAHQSPLKDVAGMLRSLDYAAQAALKSFGGSKEIALNWRDAASQAFLSGYLAAVTGTPLVPTDAAEFRALLDFHLSEKLLYELLYELRNRPDWVGIPLASLSELLS
jgi:maltose alpha-D-glucosyltransferase / alpha-amylase